MLSPKFSPFYPHFLRHARLLFYTCPIILLLLLSLNNDDSLISLPCMNASFLTENITEYLSLLGKVIPTHSQIPILSSVLVEATGGELIFSSTDLEFGVRVTLPAKIEEAGGILVPGKQFIEILSSLTHEKAVLSQEKDQLLLTAAASTFKFQAIPRDEFPRLYEEKGEKVAEFSAPLFSGIFNKLTFAVSQDESRPHLTGIYIVKKAGHVDYVATDGYRMSLKRVAGEGLSTQEEGIIVSQKLITEALSIKNEPKIQLYVYNRGNQAIIEAGAALLVGRLIEGNYPDYEKVLPVSPKTSITLDREEFSRVLKVAQVFARENANVINCTITLGTLEISVASSSLGESESKIEGNQAGDDNSISFNIKFVMDFLRSVTGKTITIRVNSPFEPALFTTDDDPEFQHVIMPVRVQE